MAGVAYYLLTLAILTVNKDTRLAEQLGNDIKGKLSLVIYLLGIALAFVDPRFSYSAYVLVQVMWFIPDHRLVGSFTDEKDSGSANVPQGLK